MPNWPHQNDCPSFYGANTRVSRGVAGPDPKWEKDKGTVIRPAGGPVCLFVPMGAS